ncbi:cell division protein FtsQ/DivIB [Cytobacillus sp. S13-E01]|uniref:cell division protein FtsQ/DivIB n=1 Tax=Cytobacillus sp. S13-E01 TaxID=3031326 RepID=UPI0023D87F31|nr:cell division protein FtsQ/DivIB [Cytobacillus sp. S13-E01]MDF0725275.1 cell division protein FtsQ/DivIB [Cytobacillus sp. S13-E01]
MSKGKVVTIEDRIPKLKQKRKQKANKRLVIYISFFFLLIIGVAYIQSPLSKVSQVKITGNYNVSETEIKKLSTLSERTSFWSINVKKMTEQIEAHEQIKSATIDKKLPNTVIINVEEHKRVAYILNKEKYLPILENGQILDSVKETLAPADAPILQNWEKGEDIQEMAVELSKLPDSITNSISEIHHSPEKSDPLHITLFMNDGYEVSATVRSFSEKMSAYPSIISELDPSLKGVIYLEVVPYFKAYEREDEKEDESER